MKKMKKLTSLGAIGVVPLVATSIAPALVLSGCGAKKRDEEVVLDLNYDDENNFDARWFDQFVESYKGAIYSQVILPTPDKDDEWKALQLKNIESSVNSFKSRLQELLNDESSRPFAYCAISNAMIDDAYDSYELPNGDKLKLDIRHSNKTFDDIDNMFKQQKRSADSLMQSTGVSKKNRDLILGNAQKSFDDLFAQLKDRYADPLSAYIKAQSRLNFLFSEVSNEIAYAGASDVLSEFMNNYRIEYNEAAQDETNRLDKLIGSEAYDEGDKKTVTFAENTDISAFLPKIFNIRNVVTGELLTSFNKYEIIPGYKISPILKKINKDYYRNEFSLEIDWTVIKQSFIGKKDAKLVTAHIINPDQNEKVMKNCLKNKAITLEDLTDEDNIINISYPVEITQDLQHKALENLYFGGNNEITDSDFPTANEKIEFRWDENIDECAYDPFIECGLQNEDTNDDEYDHVIAGTEQLAKGGIEVRVLDVNTNEETKWQRLDELMGMVSPREHTSNGGEESLNKPFILEQFLNNCSFNADCKLYPEDATRKIEYQLYALYGNTSRKSIKSADVSKAKVYPNGVKYDTLINLPLTKELYWSMTNKYNLVLGYVRKYAENPYQNLKDSVVKEKSGRIATLCVTSILSGTCAALNFVPFLKPSSRVVLAAFCALSACEIAVAGTSYGLWKKHIYKKVLEYYDRAESFAETELCQETYKNILQDGIDNHLLAGEDRHGEYYLDKEQYETNYEKNFAKSPETFSQLARFARNYSNVLTYPMMASFNKEIKDADIDLGDYERELEGEDAKWKDAVEILDNLTWGIFGCEMAFMLADILVSIRAALQAKLAAQISQGKLVKMSVKEERWIRDTGREIISFKGQDYIRAEDAIAYVGTKEALNAFAYKEVQVEGRTILESTTLSGEEAAQEILDTLATSFRETVPASGDPIFSPLKGEPGAWETLKNDLSNMIKIQDGCVVGSTRNIQWSGYGGLVSFNDWKGVGIYSTLRTLIEQSGERGARITISEQGKEWFLYTVRSFSREMLTTWYRRTCNSEVKAILKGLLDDATKWAGSTIRQQMQELDDLITMLFMRYDVGEYSKFLSLGEFRIINESFVSSMENFVKYLFKTGNFNECIHFLN